MEEEEEEAGDEEERLLDCFQIRIDADGGAVAMVRCLTKRLLVSIERKLDFIHVNDPKMNTLGGNNAHFRLIL